jgi:hypothetical protein
LTSPYVIMVAATHHVSARWSIGRRLSTRSTVADDTIVRARSGSGA